MTQFVGRRWTIARTANLAERSNPESARLVSAGILYAVVALAPLPFGSTDPVTIGVWSIALAVGLVCLKPAPLSARHLAVIIITGLLIAAYAVVLHEQLSIRPWFSAAAPHPVWQQAKALLHVDLEPSVAIARNMPFFALGAPLVSCLSFLLGFYVGMERRRARQLVRIIAWAGIAFAGYGVVAYVWDPTTILWRDKIAYQTVLTATFINRNTAAVYFGSCAAIWLLVTCEGVSNIAAARALQWRSLARLMSTAPPKPLMISSSMFVVCLLAMFMTRSRAGTVISLLGMVLAFTAFFRRELRSRFAFIVTVGAAVAVAVVVLQLAGSGIGDRFDTQGLADGGRLSTYRSTLRIIAERPWFGTGLGTFAWSYPAFRDDGISMWGVWDRAHSSVLELGSEVGIPLTLATVIVWLAALVVLCRGIFIHRRNRVVPVAALSVALIGQIHSLIDFSMQIPGFAIPIMALVGAGIAQSCEVDPQSQAAATPTRLG